MKHFKLGASIYVPATRADICAVANEEKFSCRSVIFCTEDSVNESDVPKALDNLQIMLKSIDRSESIMKFIRVRNPEILERILQMPQVEKIDGFVFPKFTADSFDHYFNKFQSSEIINNFQFMPTLETKEVFSIPEMEKLLAKLIQPQIKDKILSLRIGGNDLLHILGIRRSRYRTIYETPLSVTISNLVTIFKSNGFNLTAPVCEFLQDTELLNKEVPLDMEHGLFGKTAIHPDQIKTIESFFMVSEQDLEMAQAILKEDALAVFGMHGTMCEKATHSNWAKEILHKANIYGIFGRRR